MCHNQIAGSKSLKCGESQIKYTFFVTQLCLLVLVAAEEIFQVHM